MTERSLTPLPPEALYRRCPLDGLDFETTSDLEPLGEHLGQERAVDALRFGLAMHHEGYNLFLLGSPGVGKRELLRDLLGERPEPLAEPRDWCYVNNFDEPHKPRVLSLPAGKGRELAADMLRAVEELLVSIPAAFQSEEYQAEVQELADEFARREQEAFQALGDRARAQGVALIRTPSGYTLAPTRDDKVLSPAEFEALPEEERKRLLEVIEALKEELKSVVRQIPRWVREGREKLRALNREYSTLVIDQAFEELLNKYRQLPAVLEYLEAVKRHVADNVEAFRQAAGEDLPPEAAPLKAREFRQYAVNVVVDNGGRQGAPVIWEDHPSYGNLLGRIEHIAHQGTLVTDFGLIRAGALHHANGGYLVLDAAKVLAHPFAWEGLKRALRCGEIRIQSVEQWLSFASTIQLEPEPVPLRVKVVLTGDRLLYYLLQHYDPEFGQLFKVAADMAEETPLTPENAALYARLVRALVDRYGLLPFTRDGVARVVEQCARRVEDAEKVSLHLGYLADLLRESDYVARSRGRDRVGAEEVRAAVAAAIHRLDQVAERVRENILRDIQLVDTAGAVVGQINGLAVYQLGQFAFGKPSRITATTRMGSGGVIDIEREARLGGRIHSKGVMILSSFLASRYAADRPLSLTATLAFEQSYGGVDGDSASVAELAVLISSLSGLPVRQDLAVTGSVNQLGQVQAIGGVNEKIEGFFDVCAARGLTGTQGVVIPAANRVHLMLRDDVVEAVRAGKFAIYAITHVDEALELLLGAPAGEPDAEGRYPPESINGRVVARLEEWAKRRRKFSAEDGGKGAAEEEGENSEGGEEPTGGGGDGG
ncbi:MAG: ATP-dependent protease [Porticoccaceae bacterium]|nr:MAG: ATP-dependent protease [Porticoccaceae bacterium]